MATKALSKEQQTDPVKNLIKASTKTARSERFWLKGRPKELPVFQIPTRLLYFNIENGRYADKMIQLRADNPGTEIDPTQDKWREKIFLMLKGDYPGTEADREPFENLREDILAKTQLRPGVVLHDGGVLDGNRRLAVLLDLEKSQRNPSRFQYFEGVILNADVTDEDRWRIEAGLQIGRDEKLAYSPINQLLKIREGLRLFGSKKSPEKEIAKTLYGVPEGEIRKDIRKIELIDEYLAFIGKPRMYNEISRARATERFEEAVKAVDAARKMSWPPTELQKLKTALFAVIHDNTMDNWDLRYISLAMGSAQKGALRNDQALKSFLSIGSDPKSLRQAISQKAGDSPKREYHAEKSQEFVNQMEVLKLANQPLTLADRAKSALQQLAKALGPEQLHQKHFQNNIQLLAPVLDEIEELAVGCTRSLKKLKSRARI